MTKSLIDDVPYFEEGATYPCEVHEHDTRVDPCDPIERMACKATIPADLGDLVLGGHSRQLSGVEGLEEGPDIIHGSKEEHVCINIQQRVHLLQDHLES